MFYTEVKLRTYYGMASVRPSVRPSTRPSVRPSVSHIVSAQYLETFLINSYGTWQENWSWSVDEPYIFLGH